jgi:hypothetical protein
VTEHLREVCLLGREVIPGWSVELKTSLSFAWKACRWWDQFTFYPLDYRAAFAFSPIPDPPPHGRFSRNAVRLSGV